MRSENPAQLPADPADACDQTVRIDGPGELVAAIPYLLGFHPSASLVIVGLRARALAVTARVGLDELAEPGVLAHTVAVLARGGAVDLLGVVYDDSEIGVDTALPFSDVVTQLAARAQEVGCTVLDTLLVGRGSWRSYSCENTGCCPAEGSPLPAGTSAFAAAATFAGMVAMSDRAALARTLAPRPDAEREQLDQLIGAAENAVVEAVLQARGERLERSVKRAIFAAVRTAASGAQVNDCDAARFGVALGNHAVRDAVWMAVDDGRLAGRRLWAELSRRLPSPYDAGPLFLFGWSAWRAGNGALARIAADQALASDPSYRAADLLLGALSHGLNPRAVPKLRSSRR